MTKFTKGIVTVALLTIGVVGGKYGYDYLKEKGVFDKKNVSNISTEEIENISEFLNDKYNIGFVHFNYDTINIKTLSFDKIYKLLYNTYSFDDNGRVIRMSMNKNNSIAKYNGKYNANVGNQSMCYDTSLVNDHLNLILNQTIETNEKKLCTKDISSGIYMIDLDIIKVIKDNNKYTVDYIIHDADNLIYIESNGYEHLDIQKTYKGTVKLELVDDKYIYKYNKVDGGKPIN